jgi:hypothetical protein
VEVDDWEEADDSTLLLEVVGSAVDEEEESPALSKQILESATLASAGEKIDTHQSPDPSAITVGELFPVSPSASVI